ncbi:MAG: glycosyltransferase family 10, partial [Bacteroidota bacterium]|nr:glycosyltransferase family 10 [Bacteroidota bacterium]
MLVRIVKDWRFPDILRQTPGNTGVWENVTFTEDKAAEVDLLVVLNAPNYSFTVKCSEKWLLSQESPIDFYTWHKRSFPHFDKVFSFWNEPGILHDQTSLPWHINKSYDELLALSESDLGGKKNELSWVTSNYTNKPGHVLRMSLLSYLQEKGLQFDLFGKGFNPIDDKFNGIFPYKYSLAIENYSCNDYWT